jgi:hypothetical protein
MAAGIYCLGDEIGSENDPKLAPRSGKKAGRRLIAPSGYVRFKVRSETLVVLPVVPSFCLISEKDVIGSQPPVGSCAEYHDGLEAGFEIS